jgi:MFS family permease
VFGWLADRYGRARMLVYSILIYSLCTGLTATAGSVLQLVCWRALLGIGLGGEWSAGSVLVAETWPAAHRGKAIGLMQSGWAVGYLLAASLAAVVLPRWGWRPLFAVGCLPALLALWVRWRVPEPATGPRGPLGARLDRRNWRDIGVASAMCACLLFAYWGLFTWVPTYLASPVARGGAGLGAAKSFWWIAPMQIGAFLGYALFGVLADRLGRRPVFIAFVLAAAALVPVYGLLGHRPGLLLLLGPLVGFFGHGYFSVFGALLAELFPTAVRATAQGLCYNAGRAVSALAPFTLGVVADRRGIGLALALTAGFYILGAAFMLLLPETRAKDVRG